MTVYSTTKEELVRRINQYNNSCTTFKSKKESNFVKGKTKLEDNDTLLISEIKNSVILPYKASEIKEIIKNKMYSNQDFQTIIDEKYTVSLDCYKNDSISRFKEAFKLMREKEGASLSDSLDLAFELMRNRFLCPAIITACKNLDQLDIYLDCINTNELDDFPFFKVKYEFKPIKEKEKNIENYSLIPEKTF